MSKVLEDILDSHAEYYILATMKYMKGIGPNPALGTDGGNKQDRLSRAKLEALLSKRELEALRWVAAEGSKTNHCDDREYQVEKVKVDDRINQLTNREEK